MNKKLRLHELPDLLVAAASLLDHLGSVAGLRVGLHTTLSEGVRLLVKTGAPYTDEVGPLDRIGAALNAPIVHDRTGFLGHAYVHGRWNGTQVYAGHLYSDQPLMETPCVQQASEVSRRLWALIPWARQDWTEQAQSVHVYDENGTPRVHVVLTSEGSLDDTLATTLDATGALQYRHVREHDCVAHGSVLLDDDTVVTVSAITPT